LPRFRPCSAQEKCAVGKIATVPGGELTMAEAMPNRYPSSMMTPAIREVDSAGLLRSVGPASQAG